MFSPLSPIHLPGAFQFDALFSPSLPSSDPSIRVRAWQRNGRASACFICKIELWLTHFFGVRHFRRQCFAFGNGGIYGCERPGALGIGVGIQRRLFLHIALARHWHQSLETSRRKAVPSKGWKTDLHMRFQGSNQIRQQVQ